MSKHDEESILRRLFNNLDKNKDDFVSGTEFHEGFTSFPELKSLVSGEDEKLSVNDFEKLLKGKLFTGNLKDDALSLYKLFDRSNGVAIENTTLEVILSILDLTRENSANNPKLIDLFDWLSSITLGAITLESYKEYF